MRAAFANTKAAATLRTGAARSSMWVFAKDERRGLRLIKLDAAWNEDMVHATASFESGHSSSVSTAEG
jgi:hypothetical protein